MELDYDTLCRVIGKLYLESQLAVMNINSQMNDLYSQLKQVEHTNRTLETQLHDLRQAMSNDTPRT